MFNAFTKFLFFKHHFTFGNYNFFPYPFQILNGKKTLRLNSVVVYVCVCFVVYVVHFWYFYIKYQSL